MAGGGRCRRVGVRFLSGWTMPQYDPARRRRCVRKGRERGVWVFVPAEELRNAGFDPKDDPPFYRVWSRKRAALIQLYKEG